MLNLMLSRLTLVKNTVITCQIHNAECFNKKLRLTSARVKILSIVPERSWLLGIVLYIYATLLTNPEAVLFIPCLTNYLAVNAFTVCPPISCLLIPCMPKSPLFIHSLLARLFCCLFLFTACSPIQPIFFLACPPTQLFIHSFLAYQVGSAHLFSCLFIPCPPNGQCPPVQLFIHSLPSQWAVPTCSAVYSLLAYPMGSAHLFSCLFIPCLSVYSVVYLFLPVHLFSCLFIPSRPPIQLFINSLPAQLDPKSPSTVYVNIYIAF
jgi:hypothetical protein